MPEIKKTSMQDIAYYLNISKNAVSLALSNKKGVSEELRKKVFDAAKYLNYGGVKNTKEEISKNILAITTEFMGSDSVFYNKIFWSIEKECRNNNYNFIVTCIDSDMEQKLNLPKMINEINISGIILVGVVSREYVSMLEKLEIPMVIVDNYYESINATSILTANEEGASDIVQYLIDSGHRTIGYIGPVEMASSFKERWQGYCKAIKKNNLEINDTFCFLTSRARYLPIDDEIKVYVDSLNDYPTAWFCGNDTIALSLIHILNDKKISIPKDVSVVGFDDIEAAQYIVPKLTTVKVKRDVMGGKAVQQLIEEIEGCKDKIKISIYTDRIIRDSVKII